MKQNSQIIHYLERKSQGKKKKYINTYTKVIGKDIFIEITVLYIKEKRKVSNQ